MQKIVTELKLNILESFKALKTELQDTNKSISELSQKIEQRNYFDPFEEIKINNTESLKSKTEIEVTLLKTEVKNIANVLKNGILKETNTLITDVTKKVEEIKSDMNSLKENTKKINEELIPDVKTEVNTLKMDIENLKTNVDNLKTVIQTNSSSLKNELLKQIDIVDQDVKSNI